MKPQDKPKQGNLFETIESTIQEKPKNQKETVNLLELNAAEEASSLLETVRLGSDETPIIPFTAESTPVNLHFCPEAEIHAFVVCNGPGCVLCRIGRKQEPRLLVPVYLPAAGQIGVLAVSRSLRPFALLPQLLAVLKANRPTVMFVVREAGKYTVSTNEIGKDVDAGEIVIKQFRDEYSVGMHDPTAAFLKIDNDNLAAVDEIGRMMKLKGISLNAGNQRP